jgi:hypothetical protein
VSQLTLAQGVPPPLSSRCGVALMLTSVPSTLFNSATSPIRPFGYVMTNPKRTRPFPYGCSSRAAVTICLTLANSKIGIPLPGTHDKSAITAPSGRSHQIASDWRKCPMLGDSSHSDFPILSILCAARVQRVPSAGQGYRTR